jgi:hypothetical protein
MSRRIQAAIEIAAPIERVRRHFWDMRHHESTPVHAGVRFEVEEMSDERCVYRQRTRFLGLELVDVLENTRGPEGQLFAHTIAGPSAGMRTTFRFAPVNEGSTRVEVEVELAARGAMRALAPLFAPLIRRRFARALEEDRRDLEGGGYV